MKKLALTIAIGMTIGLSAQESQQTQQGLQSQLSLQSGGLFERGYSAYEVYSFSESSNNSELFANLRNSLFPVPVLPNHGATENQEATPLGSGIAVLLGLGAAYAVAKKRKED